jgi:hypothetical protein
MGSGGTGVRSRRSVAGVILLALLVAGLATGAAAYVLRPSPGTSDAGVPTTVAAAAPVIFTATATPSPAPRPSPTPRRLLLPERTATLSPTSAPTRTSTPAPTATPMPLFSASRDDLADWTGPGWTYADGILANDGTGIANRPWLAAPFVPPDGPYAVEARIRVRGLASGVCEQSFGVVAGGSGGIVWGGGVVFGCDGAAHARVTDVTDVTDGYNRDRVLETAAFDPGDDWHIYRLEVDGNRLRLLVDDRLVLEASDDESVQDGEPGVVGLWSQGVSLEVRRVAVFAR